MRTSGAPPTQPQEVPWKPSHQPGEFGLGAFVYVTLLGVFVACKK